MHKIKEVINKKNEDIDTVNSNNCNTGNNITDNSIGNRDDISQEENRHQNTFKEELNNLYLKHNVTSEQLAKEVSEKLNDTKSYSYHLLLAQNTDHDVIREALAITLDKKRRDGLRAPAVHYFRSVLQRMGVKTKFRSY